MTSPESTPMDVPARFGHFGPAQIHFEDLDANGAVHDSRYLLLVERAVMDYWFERGWHYDPPLSRFDDVCLVVRHVAIGFHTPIIGVGPITVHFWIDQVATSSLTYGFHVLSADLSVLHAEGSRTQVRSDPSTHHPITLSVEMVAEAHRLRRPRGFALGG
ncbi:acyl-CoA thioesterase [Actinoalloteichus hymeniacidonis]|uniref:Thioesterase n=1 Tax=Actinoalloteichus hymeniacidonis TaxID=340345 RepID=A0AAC9HRC0_9PSEU|nr:hotdog domain-containing protein [Actinoalloteichus hymeniacidonis]AOS63923.1 putative thioesterase [Actinoalloteichus hymeniacidonis]MBB5908021.1 acyl-CoA thioester hydrolase [Actinoalloteichus hymeniacidonis]